MIAMDTTTATIMITRIRANAIGLEKRLVSLLFNAFVGAAVIVGAIGVDVGVMGVAIGVIIHQGFIEEASKDETLF